MKTQEVTECFFCIIEGKDPIKTPIVCDQCGKPACAAQNHIDHLVTGTNVTHHCLDCKNG